MLSGGGSFGALDYSFTPGHEDGADTAPNGPGGGSPAFRQQLGILQGFLQSLPLRQMAVDAHLVSRAGSTYPRAMSDGKVYAVYFDGDGPADVVLNLPEGEFSGEWLNTETGKREAIPAIHSAGGIKSLMSPDFKNGIALRLERKP